jgi:hypothetical protein
MSNSEPTEKQNEIKFDLSGQLMELVQFIIAIDDKISSIDVVSWVGGKKEVVQVKWLK